MQEIKERKLIDDSYKWNLKTIYESDEAWENALKETESFAATGASFQGKLNNSDSILQFCNWQNDTFRIMNKLFNYASLRSSEDQRDSKAQSMEARVFSRYVEISSAISYSVPELLSIDDEKMNEIIHDDKLEGFKFQLENILRDKPHILSAKEEFLLNSLSEGLRASDNAATMLLDADLTFEDIEDKDGNKLPLSNANYIPYQMSKDRVLRKNAFKSYYKSYKQFIHTLAATYGGAITKATTEAKLRNYASSREMKMSVDNIPVSVYDNLVDTIHNNMHLMYRYVALRKKILGLDDVHYYDIYTPLANGSSKTYSYEQAKEMVVEAVKPLGEDYVNRVKQAYVDGWIDVYPNIGKTGGAYSSGTYDTNPFILLNYSGSLDAVSTLAHEMGHSQHSWLTNHTQPFQYSSYTMFVAEVASTVNENLLIDQLLEKCDDPVERLALLNQSLDGFKGTIYRQTMFAEFEKKAHAMKEAGQSIDADSLGAMYKELVQLYFGPEFVWDDEAYYEWARIPHFYNPFYVYVYATGYASAVALSEGILNDGQSAVDKYLEFLSMGCSKYPLDELKHAGVDLNTPEPIERALKKFERLLEDAEQTYAKIAK